MDRYLEDFEAGQTFDAGGFSLSNCPAITSRFPLALFRHAAARHSARRQLCFSCRTTA